MPQGATLTVARYKWPGSQSNTRLSTDSEVVKASPGSRYTQTSMRLFVYLGQLLTEGKPRRQKKGEM